jgi:TDG/mug DNA glycosylase family protein
LTQGIGLTDVVKRATQSSGDLRQDEFDNGVEALLEKIRHFQPRVACFVGLLGATVFLGRAVRPGPLSERIGHTRLFAIPSPSRRNAHYGQTRILGCFRKLAAYVSGPDSEIYVPLNLPLAAASKNVVRDT